MKNFFSPPNSFLSIAYHILTVFPISSYSGGLRLSSFHVIFAKKNLFAINSFFTHAPLTLTHRGGPRTRGLFLTKVRQKLEMAFFLQKKFCLSKISLQKSTFLTVLKKITLITLAIVCCDSVEDIIHFLGRLIFYGTLIF